MKTRGHFLIAGFALLVGVGCGPDSGLVTPPESGPQFLLGTWPASDLEQQLLAEMARIAQEAERSIAVYDSLGTAWIASLQSHQFEYYQLTSSGIVYCQPLPYAADAQIIGPGGGDLSIGPHRLRIPRGALKDYVVITGEMPVSLSVGVRFSPKGLIFDRPPQLTLSYKHCFLPTNHAERVAYVDEALNVLEYPTSSDRTKSGVVDAWLWHFSNYAVAW